MELDHYRLSQGGVMLFIDRACIFTRVIDYQPREFRTASQLASAPISSQPVSPINSPIEWLCHSQKSSIP